MSGFITQPISNDSLFFNPTFFSSLSLDSRFRNITNGTATASKALILDENSSISGINTIGASTLTLGGQLRISDTIRFNRSSSGSILQSANGTSSLTMYHFNNGSVVLGTTSANTISLQTNNIGRLTIDSGGAVSIGGTLACSSLNITPSTATIGGNTVSGCVYRTSGDRYYGQRSISSNSYSLLSLSAGGSYIDSIVYNHSVAPSNLPLISFNASIATTNNIACGGSISSGGGLSFSNTGTTDIITGNLGSNVFKITNYSNACVIGSESNHGISFQTNSSIRFQIAPTGFATFNGGAEILGNQNSIIIDYDIDMINQLPSQDNEGFFNQARRLSVVIRSLVCLLDSKYLLGFGQIRVSFLRLINDSREILMRYHTKRLNDYSM